MRASLILFGGIIVLSLAVARALSCVCSPLECDILTAEDCPGGLTWDPCKCCQVCARVEGEPCGGLFGFSGRCAVGLQCVIKNLRPPDELDEGTCSKIPGRWRRHCPHGQKMSRSGCNLIGDSVSSESGNSGNAGRCVCGPAVPWCPDEPHPYTFATRHECKLNLAAKIAYDDVLNSPDSMPPNGFNGAKCPDDSVTIEDGGCKCVSPCPPPKCREDQRPVQVKAAEPETPGSCCPLYHCVLSESISWVDTDDQQQQKCIDVETGLPRAIGERWQRSPCIHCTCEEINGFGSLSCQATMCKSCERQTKPLPGECCPHCLDHANETDISATNSTETVTATSNTITTSKSDSSDSSSSSRLPIETCDSLEDCEPPCHFNNVDDLDACPTCECPDSETISSPDATDKMCPEQSQCSRNCAVVKDQHGCPVCTCPDRSLHDVTNSISSINGGVVGPEEDEDDMNAGGGTGAGAGGGVICPKLKCDLHCERGLIMDENDCTLCQCKPHTIGCLPLSGCKKKCPYGFKSNRRGCPICRCRATCIDHHNETYPEGSSWKPDVCTSCTCDSLGRLTCKETVCSVACTNPLPPKPGICCPVCHINEIINGNNESHQAGRGGWGIVLITLVAILTLLCIILMIFVVRGRFRGRLSPSSNIYPSNPAQYYKYVPAYDTPVRISEKVVPL